FNVYHNDALVAGATIFETKTTAHVQYISSNQSKNKLGSLDFLFNNLITELFKHKLFFDFGNSNEQNGEKLNQGLLYWKEGFGAKSVTQDFHQIETINFSNLDNLFI
ncbi:GNAT family N-acetyltransferase, partial [Flavobacteriaceae bacterium]|nr:GNAT family N-acetyltransferase [Flavobacteriaceae bacterium]